MSKELLHAETIRDDLNYLRGKLSGNEHRRMLAVLFELLELSERVVSTSYDEQAQAIEELEVFLS